MLTDQGTILNRSRGPLADMPMLDRQQAGSIRHIANIAGQLPDDWSHMMARTSLQEDFGAFRFQLAYMFYALALAHVHRLPAAPGVFRKPMQNLIKKIMSPDCWTYWHYVSTGGSPFNRSLGEMPGEWNPVKKDNIMYSAYLQSMTLMYHYLFDDARYAEPGALTLRHEPLFWGNGVKEYIYDEKTLNEQIYWNMVETGYLGVACEPNCIFQICSQPPILGFRFHDLIYGGSVAKEVTDGYKKAWAEFGNGYLDDDGHYYMLIQNAERSLVRAPGLASMDFWCASLMSSWNADFVKEQYPRHIATWVKEGPNDTRWVPPPVPFIKSMNDLTTASNFGWASVCASEMGDSEILSGLLTYADTYMGGTWKNGGYYYPRNDTKTDEDGNFCIMDPCTGNALLSYARLNVPGGLEKFYAGPWDKSHHAEPALDDLSGDVEVMQARFDAPSKTLVLTIAPRAQGPATAKLTLTNIWQRGAWVITIDDTLVSTGTDNEVSSSGPVQAWRDGDALMLELGIDSSTTLIVTWADA